MENLARNNSKERDNVTETCRLELLEAGVEVVPLSSDNEFPKYSEVPTVVGGYLEGFSFVRRWYYWSVTGRMPNAAAKWLNEIAFYQVRVRGFAGGTSVGDKEFTDGYHVDEQLGLNLLAWVIKNLDSPKAPWNVE